MPVANGRLVIPPNTLPTAPVHTDLYIGSRRLLGVSVHFPPGCMGLVYVAFTSTYQVVAEYMHGDNREIAETVDMLIDEPGYITAWGYNLAIDWEHTVELTATYERPRFMKGAF